MDIYSTMERSSNYDKIDQHKKDLIYFYTMKFKETGDMKYFNNAMD